MLRGELYQADHQVIEVAHVRTQVQGGGPAAAVTACVVRDDGEPGLHQWGQHWMHESVCVCGGGASVQGIGWLECVWGGEVCGGRGAGHRCRTVVWGDGVGQWCGTVV